MAGNVVITNVPNGLITTKTDKRGNDFGNIRFKYEPSVGGNGYGVLRVPASSVTETSPKFSKVELDSSKRYGVFYRNEAGQNRTDWLNAGDVKKAFDATRQKKQSAETSVDTQAAAPQVGTDISNDYGDLEF